MEPNWIVSALAGGAALAFLVAWRIEDQARRQARQLHADVQRRLSDRFESIDRQLDWLKSELDDLRWGRPCDVPEVDDLEDEIQ